MNIRSILFSRRLVQWGCLLAFVAIPFLNRAEINALSGNFLAFNLAGVPLSDPLSALQVALPSFSLDSVVLGGLITLCLALVMGPVFCSWLCPYGLFSELTRSLSSRLPFRNRQSASVPHDLKNGASVRKEKTLKGLSGTPFVVRLTIVAIGLFLVLTVVPFPLLSQLSMPGWYSRFWQHVPLHAGMLWGGLAFFLGMLLLELLLRQRFWCRYCCPQSVLLSLTGLLLRKRLHVRFNPRSCTCPAVDRKCGKACSLLLDPRHPNLLAQRAQCTNCGDCVDACQDKGRALSLGFGNVKK